MKKILILIAPERFRDEEYFIPLDLLSEAGFRVVTTSTVLEPVSKLGQKAKAGILLEEVRSDDYEALVISGGSGAAVYQQDKKVHALAKSFLAENKLLAAICISPTILVYAGLLTGKNATVHPNYQDVLKEAGVKYTDDPVTIDGNIITGRDPDSANEFAEAIIDYLNK